MLYNLVDSGKDIHNLLVLDPEFMDMLVIDNVDGIGDIVTSKICKDQEVTIPIADMLEFTKIGAEYPWRDLFVD